MKEIEPCQCGMPRWLMANGQILQNCDCGAYRTPDEDTQADKQAVEDESLRRKADADIESKNS